MTPEDQKIKSRIQEIFPDPVVASKVADAVVHDRPLGWSRRSNTPYYKEVYAKQIQRDADRMIQSGQSLVYKYDTWCSDGGMSHQTLYNRIYQSIKYLLEQLDPDKVYADWHDRTVRYKSTVGIKIDWIAGMAKESQPFSAEVIQPDSNKAKWRMEIDSWLEDSSKTAPLMVTNLALLPDEMKELIAEFKQLDNIIFEVKSSTIKLVKVNA
jgi:hypothetical protein